MNKRGEIELVTTWMIDIMLILILLFGVFNPALSKQNSNKKFYKRFSAKNVALLIDTIYTAPYPLKIFYDEKTLAFSYLFEEDTVYVIDEDENENTKSKIGYHFIEDSNQEFEYKRIDPRVTIENKDTKGDKEDTLYIPIAFVSSPKSVKPLSAIPTSDLLGDGDSSQEKNDINDNDVQDDECSVIQGRDVQCLLDPNVDYFTDHPDKDCIVIHFTAIELEAVKTNDAMIRIKDKSVQYIVGRDGEIVQEVLDKYGAYHTGCFEGCTDDNCCESDCPVCEEDGNFINPNKRCIGIEIANLGNQCGYDDENFKGIPCTNYEGIEFEEYPDKQIDAVADLVKYLIKKHNIPVNRNHIVAHSQIAIGKPDPGPAFDWDGFMKLIKE
jgi:N-acetyl-anhydromuramyl-L-alanine amidase AmpD